MDYMSFEQVLRELQIDEDELKTLISQGELRGFRDGRVMKFKRADVLNLKRGREAEPTIILTDSDQELGIAESSDELILDESTSDTLLNIGDIMGSSEEEEIIFSDSTEEFSISPHESDPEAAIPTVEVPSIDEDLGLMESESDAALYTSSAGDLYASSAGDLYTSSASELYASSSGSELYASSGVDLYSSGTSDLMETEQFELIEEDDASDVAIAPRRTPSGRVTRSARLRSMQVQPRATHTVWTGLLLFVLLVLSTPAAVLVNRANETTPQWVIEFAGNLRGVFSGIFKGI